MWIINWKFKTIKRCLFHKWTKWSKEVTEFGNSSVRVCNKCGEKQIKIFV